MLTFDHVTGWKSGPVATAANAIIKREKEQFKLAYQANGTPVYPNTAFVTWNLGDDGDAKVDSAEATYLADGHARVLVLN